VLASTGRRQSDEEDKQVLQNVKVKQSLYRRWKPITSESIELVMEALKSALRFVESSSAAADF